MLPRPRQLREANVGARRAHAVFHYADVTPCGKLRVHVEPDLHLSVERSCPDVVGLAIAFASKNLSAMAALCVGCGLPVDVVENNIFRTLADSGSVCLRER